MRNGAPFSKPKVRLVGKTSDAQAHLGDAYNLLYKVRAYCEAAGVPVFAMSRMLENGAHVAAAVVGNEEIVSCTPSLLVLDESKLEEAQSSVEVSRLVWKPEGFVITPRSEGAPDGWGLPETEDGLGTPGGPIRQVIINRYRHNKYPDHLFRQMPPTKDARFFAAPFFYTNAEEGLIGFSDQQISPERLPKGWEAAVEYDEMAGVVRAGFAPQILPRWRERVVEKEQGEWFCHRPQFMQYKRVADEVDYSRYDIHFDLFADIFEATNEYRVSLGNDPLSPPLRGYYNGLARSVVSQMQATGVQAHDAEEFKEGYRKFAERVRRFSHPTNAAAENLITLNTPVQGLTLGQSMVEAWIESSGHRSNILFNWTGKGLPNASEISGFLELSSGFGTVTKAQGPPYTEPAEDVPPASGVMAAQVFSRGDKWVREASVLWEGEAGCVGIASEPNAQFRYLTTNLPVTRHTDSIVGSQAVFIGGRRLVLNEPSERHVIMGAALFHDDDGKLFLSAAYYYLPTTQSEPVKFRLMVWDMNKLPSAETGEGFPEPEEIHEHTLPDETFAFTRVLFSHSGKKCTFSYHLREEWPDNYLLADEIDFRERGTLPKPLYGTSIVHVEFDGESFTPSGKQVVMVNSAAGRSGDGTGFSQNHYEASCAGSYVLWRDWDVDELFDIVCEGENTVVFREDYVESRCFGKLTYPKGEFVHSDLAAIGDPSDQGSFGSTGFANLLLHFDARTPEDTVFVALEPGFTYNEPFEPAPGTWFAEFGPPIRYGLTLKQTLYFSEEAVKINENVMSRIDEESDPYFNGHIWSVRNSSGIPSATHFRTLLSKSSLMVRRYFASPLNYVNGAAPVRDDYGSSAGDVCIGAHHATLSPQTLGNRTTLVVPYADNPQEFCFAPYIRVLESDTVDRTFNTPAGPTDYSINGLANVSFVRYMGEHIVAGRFGQVFGLKKHGQQDDDQYFWRSSLDLEALTGAAGLNDNILPIGVVK